MSRLIAIVFHGREEAEEARGQFSLMDENDRIHLEDAVIAFKSPTDEIQINQLHDFAGTGAKQGGIAGLVLGMVLATNPAGGALGASTGAAIGNAIGAFIEKRIDPSINSDIVKELTDSVTAGKMVLVVLFSQAVWPQRFLERLKEIGGTVIHNADTSWIVRPKLATEHLYTWSSERHVQ